MFFFYSLQQLPCFTGQQGLSSWSLLQHVPCPEQKSNQPHQYQSSVPVAFEINGCFVVNGIFELELRPNSFFPLATKIFRLEFLGEILTEKSSADTKIIVKAKKIIWSFIVLIWVFVFKLTAETSKLSPDQRKQNSFVLRLLVNCGIQSDWAKRAYQTGQIELIKLG